jgi:hypothetical protein
MMHSQNRVAQELSVIFEEGEESNIDLSMLGD